MTQDQVLEPPRPEGQDATSPRTYAVGDVHGRLDLLRMAVKAIADHVGTGPFRVVFLGDYVDRGPDSRGVVDFLIDLQRRWPVTCLKGNHEELMVQALCDPAGRQLERWLEYGGDQTLKSYDLGPDDDLAAGVPGEHIRWMSALPRTTGDGHRIYVHAGLMPGTPIQRQKEETCLWIRERFLQARPGDFEAHVVHGHTPVWEGKPDPAEPELLEHRTNLDTGAFATGVLSVAVFDSAAPGGPIEVLKVSADQTVSVVPEPAASPSAPSEPGKRRHRLPGWFVRRPASAGSK
ncbi:MAG TPA: metallophosphoesterase family protein [Caulobacteraceae bacterium]|nr:metallophosphoesterase family protein [Caulobacteraceae bacterium]